MKNLLSFCKCTKKEDTPNKDLEMTRDDFNAPGYTPNSKGGYNRLREP